MITPELKDALAATRQAPRGADQVRAAERAVLLADEIGEPDGILQARISLVSSRNGVPEDPGDLAMIGWLLTQLDTDVPDQHDRGRILWFGKWAMERVINIPEISLQTAQQMLDDVARRVQAEGFSERPVAQQRTRLALQAGTEAEIDHWLGRWRSAPRDDLADCFACEASLFGEIEAGRDDHEQALISWQPVIVGETSCAEQPHVVLGDAVDSLLRTGRIDDAVAAHQRGWRLTKADPVFAVPMARQLMFDVRAGYTAEAVTRLLPRLDWRDQLPLASEQMYFSGIAAAVLDAGRRIGATPDMIGDEPVDTVIDSCRRTADRIAGQFDSRNATTVISRQLAAATNPTPYQVPIVIPGLVADSAPDDTEDTDAPTDPIDLARRLRARLDDGIAGTDLVDRWQRLRRQPGDDQASEQTWSARAYLDRQLAQHRADADPETAGRLFTEARNAAERAGDKAELFLIEVASLGLTDTPDPDRIAAAHRGVDEMVAAGRPDAAAKALLPLSGAAASADRAGLLTRAAELFDVADDHGWALLSRVHAVQAAELDPDEAAERLGRIQDDATAAGQHYAVVQAMSARAALAAGTGDPETAAADYRAAADHARTHQVGFSLGSGYGLTTVLLDLQDWAGAREVAQDLISRATREADDRVRSYATWLLAIAEQQLGNPTSAAELIESILPAFRRLDGAPLGQALWLLGQALSELGEPGAEAAYVEAADFADAADAPAAALQARYHAGRVAWQHDAYERAAPLLDAVIAAAPELGELDLLIGATRIRANVLADRSVEEAVRTLQALPDRIAELAADSGRLEDLDLTLLTVDVERHSAELYALEGEWQSAFDHLDRAEQQLGDRFEALVEVRADRGRYLADAGRVDEATALLEQVLPQLDPDRRYPATAALCNALARAGREEEAQATWTRHLGE
ncbi:hypothetical protein [Microlunatus soli]|uniref:Tetratricopeptide repeat-containing protein n=1 Tax=Microlunatus soli TaxID=630515 RepID=A0A1H1XEZ7_9ACTN|nr:hypothetical protein [Microlunatus soli]SDT07256.1 hypothetical protein SAMN04489812_4035 [Microlunatus soli]